MNLLDLVIEEYLAITEHLLKKYNPDANKLFIDSEIFYAFLDKNLYVQRSRKLTFYKQLNFITCNSKGYTSVVYDKDLKKTVRKFVLNLETFKIIKNYRCIKINE